MSSVISTRGDGICATWFANLVKKKVSQEEEKQREREGGKKKEFCK
jgi:hypothetical protein